jgi:hypothetical protein
LCQRWAATVFGSGWNSTCLGGARAASAVAARPSRKSSSGTDLPRGKDRLLPQWPKTGFTENPPEVKVRPCAKEPYYWRRRDLPREQEIASNAPTATAVAKPVVHCQTASSLKSEMGVVHMNDAVPAKDARPAGNPAVLHTTEVKTSTQSSLTQIFSTAFHDAMAGRGSMDEEVYKVDGFCGRKFRLLLNNMVKMQNGLARYLEVGSYKGATICPVMSNNSVVATVIDDWSWDVDNKVASSFHENVAKFKTPNTKLTVIEDNFRNIGPNDIGKFNIYFYDGNHNEKDQYDGIIWSMAALDQTAIVLVDDWNWLRVRSGTMNALRDAGVQIEYMLELRTSFDDKVPRPAFGKSDWHNGFFGAVISKQS